MMFPFPHPYYVVSDEPRRCSGLNPCWMPLRTAIKFIVVFEIISTVILATLSKILVICILNGVDLSALPDIIITFFISNFYQQVSYSLVITIVFAILILLQFAFLAICIVLLCKPSNLLCTFWIILYLTIWVGPFILAIAISDLYEAALCIFPSIIIVVWFTWTVFSYGKHMKKMKQLAKDNEEQKRKKFEATNPEPEQNI